MSTNEEPGYADELSALHVAHERELRAIVDELPLGGRPRVLDLACGDGTITRWIADRVGPGGEVVGVDVSEPYLERAAQATTGAEAKVRLVCADFEDDFAEPSSFDLAVCAFSLYSLPDPDRVVDRLRRMTRPGGTVALLENDHLHHVVLPWPAELEVEVRRAELRAFEAADGERDRRWFVGRRLGELLSRAGLTSVDVVAKTVVRQTPLQPTEMAYLDAFLAGLRARARPYLSPDHAYALEAWTDPESPEGVFRREGGQISFVHQLAMGTVPRVAHEPLP